ncbi:ATP/GTP-binding protein [Nonomuraea sp. NPDC049028]|uniref:AAA family ATPase n=1 Tax=Nonomuraea sp. NPDC049028 TaxID=3364348 RepID=UPI00371B647A
MLLRFRVANHRSIRDEQTLSLVSVPRRGERPKELSTVRVAGIYGANASGKSNVLSALKWMQFAISDSHQLWSPSKGVPRDPFRLPSGESSSPSFCELDFLHDGIRYSYGFEVDDRRILGEWLNTFPKGRTKKLFDRTGPTSITFGRSLVGETQRILKLTRPNSLYLSAAAANNHPLLTTLYNRIRDSIFFAQHGDHDERSRLFLVKELLNDESVASIINRLVRIADLGVEAAEIFNAVPTREEILRQMADLGQGATGSSSGSSSRTDIRLRRTSGAVLELSEESAGTRVWLSLLGHSLAAIASGGTLVADEIDSHLHPLLSSTLIRIFKDPVINKMGAQLVFASHDTTLLGSMLEEEVIDRDEVWFTEKDSSGATSLYSLAEFHPRRDENIERGYLQGRYGAVPYINFDSIREVFTKGPDETL